MFKRARGEGSGSGERETQATPPSNPPPFSSYEGERPSSQAQQSLVRCVEMETCHSGPLSKENTSPIISP